MNNQKVVWSEGMFLKPQHFQQWDRYYENTLKFRLNSLIQHGWGVKAMEIDKNLVENGSFSLMNFTGLMMDGLPVNIPSLDESPKLREFKKYFTTSSDILEVFLSIPAIKDGISACQVGESSSESRATRYRQSFVNVVDENTGQNEYQIPYAKKNLEIRFSGEDMDDFIFIKIAEVVRSQTGKYSIKEDYIPPSIALSANTHLMSTVGRIYEKLCTKSTAFSERQTRSLSDMSEFGPANISNLWFLYTVNSHIPILQHYYYSGQIHPESLFCTLSRLAGELRTFSNDSSPKDLPHYEHENLSNTFHSLEKKLDDFLEVVISIKFVVIPLKKSKDNIYSGQITDERLLDSARMFLAVAGDYPIEEILDKVPRLVKISSLDTIDVVVSTNTPGISLTYIATLPASVPVKMGLQYFQLDNFGDYWDRLRDTRTIAIYIPSGISGLKIELMAVKD